MRGQAIPTPSPPARSVTAFAHTSAPTAAPGPQSPPARPHRSGVAATEDVVENHRSGYRGVEGFDLTVHG